MTDLSQFELAIPFTQYLRPHGRKIAQFFPVDGRELFDLAEKFLKSGGRYECEVLTTGHVSLTAVHRVDGEDQDVVTEICSNGPAVPAAVDRLVRRSIAWLETGGLPSGI